MINIPSALPAWYQPSPHTHDPDRPPEYTAPSSVGGKIFLTTVLLVSCFIFRRALDAAATAAIFWALKTCRPSVEKHPLLLCIREPVLGFDRGGSWVWNGPMEGSNIFHGEFPPCSQPANDVPYGELAKGRGQMSADITVTTLTACEFIHQKVITLCSGKDLF